MCHTQTMQRAMTNMFSNRTHVYAVAQKLIFELALSYKNWLDNCPDAAAEDSNLYRLRSSMDRCLTPKVNLPHLKDSCVDGYSTRTSCYSGMVHDKHSHLT